MSLAEYHRKRQFGRTPEPRGKQERVAGPLRFVVQKHQASRLHYDLRLELDGTLKSWAVPKGPSLQPSDKRLAIMVEDHPLDYRTFEGIIPAGNYGAGTVLVWDEGTYAARDTTDRAASERQVRQGLREGHLRFVLHGQKLRGEFSLVRLKRGKANEWLLIKSNDDWADAKDVTADEQSVASGRTLAEIGEGKRPGRSRAGKSGRNGKPAAPRKPIKPMLATLVDKPFDRPGWFFELKWDGYRAIAEVTRQQVRLYSRNQQPFEKRFAPIVESLTRLKHEAVLDGEIVVVDDQGRSRFQLLQNYQKTGEGRLIYYVFDLLELDGEDLRESPLVKRRKLLKQVVRGVPRVLLSEDVEESGVAFFEAVRAQGLEGIIAKDGASTYQEGRRSQAWLKIKTHQRQEAVIGGFTKPRGRRQNFGALLLGVYRGDDLVCIGHNGTGFDSQALSELHARLKPLVRRSCPFVKRPKTNAPVQWVEPEIVCEVSFQEWTEEAVLRHPVFVGLREDKPAREVRREQPQSAAPDRKKPGRTKKTSPASAHTRNAAARVAGSAPVPRLTNLEKIYWPEDGFTKGDLIDYYRTLAPVLLPHLHDRPLSLHRHPDGIAGKSFFQKDVSRQPPPDWVQTVRIESESAGETITYLLGQDQASLLYVANLGCIELNPWNSRIQALDKPDYLILDLDPEAIPFERVIEAALVVGKTLEKAGASCFCKTSGKRGLHVCVPLGARCSYDQAREFAEIVSRIVHQKLPKTTSLVRSPAQRQGRVYLDYLQNRRGQTLASAYSVRPYPGAAVSAPLRWREVKRGLDPAAFNLRSMPKRLDKLGDLWEPLLGSGVDLLACLERLSRT